jgi:hypothetical protein
VVALRARLAKGRRRVRSGLGGGFPQRFSLVHENKQVDTRLEFAKRFRSARLFWAGLPSTLGSLMGSKPLPSWRLRIASAMMLMAELSGKGIGHSGNRRNRVALDRHPRTPAPGLGMLTTHSLARFQSSFSVHEPPVPTLKTMGKARPLPSESTALRNAAG